MLVKNKTRDIAILRTVGASQSSMLRIFFIAGAAIGIAGTVTKSGYTIVMTGEAPAATASLDACNLVAAADLSGSYTATADPTSPGSTGVRYFWTNTLGTIYTDTTNTWTAGTGVTPTTDGGPLQ